MPAKPAAFSLDDKHVARVHWLAGLWFPGPDGKPEYGAYSRVIQHLIATADPAARPERKEEGAGLDERL